jgi:lipocalin
MRTKLIFLFAFILISFNIMFCYNSACPEVDIKQKQVNFEGDWYEYEKTKNNWNAFPGECLTVNYNEIDKNKYDVTIKMLKKDDSQFTTLNGTLYSDENAPQLFHVDLGETFKGDVYFLVVDKNSILKYACVNGERFVWILSKSTWLSESVRTKYYDIVKTYGVDKNDFRFVVHNKGYCERI